jgi:hypothetical protein
MNVIKEDGIWWHTPLLDDDVQHELNQIPHSKTCGFCNKKRETKQQRTYRYAQEIPCDCFDEQGKPTRKYTCAPIVEKYGRTHYQIWGIRPTESDLDCLADGVDTEDSLEPKYRSWLSKGEPITTKEDVAFWIEYLTSQGYTQVQAIACDMLEERDPIQFYLKIKEELN